MGPCESHYSSCSFAAADTCNTQPFQSYPRWLDGLRVELVCKLRTTVQYSFAVACINNPLIRTLTTRGREVQTCHKSRWPECIPPVGIHRVFYMNA